MTTLSHHPQVDLTRAGRWLGWLGGGFLILGGLAILAPQGATLAVEGFLASMILIWGGLGLGTALAVRPMPEWGFAAAAYAVLAALGAGFLAWPGVGIEVLTLVAVAGFLVEGVVSILIGLRSSHGGRGWVWMVASGGAALAVGLLLLLGWPGTAAWLIGVLFGINFLSTGIALLAFRRVLKALAA